MRRRAGNVSPIRDSGMRNTAVPERNSMLFSSRITKLSFRRDIDREQELEIALEATSF